MGSTSQLLDMPMAERHIARLTGAADAMNVAVTFQTFDDQGLRKDKSLARTFRGTLKQFGGRLSQFQSRGAGVFITVAETKGDRRKNSDVVAMRAIFKEDDNNYAADPLLAPHLVVQTSPGKRHLYYLTRTEKVEEWRAVMETLVRDFGSDPNAKDPARVLRLAGSWHQKDPTHPHLVTILECSDAKPYAWEQIVEAIPPSVKATATANQQQETVPADYADPEVVRDLRSALCYMGEVDRACWVKIGHALKELGEVGYQLFSEYSQRSPHFELDSFREYWEGFKPTAIGYTALFKMAESHGWVNPKRKKVGQQQTSPFVPEIRTAESILKMELPDMVWVLPGFIAQGVTLLVASPKIGKSWLALQVSLATAAGTTVLGRTAAQGKVLFLGLEDGNRRLKDRLLTLDADALPEAAQGNLQFETNWPRVDQGGIEHIENWLTANSDSRLVVIDVLQKFRAPRSPKSDVYAEDYEAMRRLKEVSEKYRVAILVIHHTRKSTADDVLETVSGSQGLTGAADAILIIKRKRGEESAELHVTGRDLPSEGSYVVTFDKKRCRWSMVGPENEVAPSAARAEILDLLRDGELRGATQIALETGKSRANIGKLLRKMREAGMVMQVGRGKYTTTTHGYDGYVGTYGTDGSTPS